MKSGRTLRLAWVALMWLALAAAPFWMPFVGGYTALGTRVLVLGLAAMSVNFLLGFTGVLSFGHAAWFGLGAYGCGLLLKFGPPSKVPVRLPTPPTMMAMKLGIRRSSPIFGLSPI